jgi:hypothetical protein
LSAVCLSVGAGSFAGMTSIQHFDWPVAGGIASLAVPCAAPGDGIAQAQALAPALPMLAALEAWLGVELPCPQPIVDGGREAPAGSLVLPFEAQSPLVGGRLVMPWAALKPGRPAAAALAVQWPQLPARVCLQRLPGPRIAAERLEAGAVLLLPDAFAGEWMVWLHPDTAPLDALPARWQAAQGRLFAPADARFAEPAARLPAHADWSAWLSEPVAFDLRLWFGASPRPLDLPPACAVELRLGNEPLAWGRLLPCGAGWGLRIERVESREAAAAWT